MIFDARNAVYATGGVLAVLAVFTFLLLAWALSLRDRRRREHPYWMAHRRGVYRSAGMLVLAILLFGALTYPPHWKLQRALRDGSYTVVRGPLEEATLAPPEGHARHLLVVEGRRYTLRHGEPGFAEIANAGPWLQRGATVRVLDADGRIARLEVTRRAAETPVLAPSAPAR
jgi:hypothetical protein